MQRIDLFTIFNYPKFSSSIYKMNSFKSSEVFSVKSLLEYLQTVLVSGWASNKKNQIANFFQGHVVVYFKKSLESDQTIKT